MEQKLTLRRLLTAIVVAVTMTMMAKDTFTALEQQQISIATKGLFDKSDAFTVDFDILKDRDYSFPLPVGKAKLMKDNQVVHESACLGNDVDTGKTTQEPASHDGCCQYGY